ncbi:hypothetical protein niasHT_004621 [Heterodera trifolii]|uniref:IRS-type PTB domain-containing protein n=1 Tax=Heterodera trifolii TaxID=157864 RepID=A0ABD2M7H0_9BILA
MTTSIGGAAFPTVSPTASSSRKSFFDTSAAFGTTISGHALVAVFPVTKKSGRVRQCFVTVQQTLFEVHKNQKDAKNKKPAKYLVDFGDVFNVSMHNEPIQIKDDCICIMDPNTSFFVRPIDSDYDLTAWFDWILERSRECRSTKLLRPVFREEFFEAAWDVQIVKRPKLRCDYSKQQPDAQNDDLTEKRTNLLGFRRLCFCANSFLLFSIGCRPIANVDAPEPFERSAFVELPLNVVSNYGTQERFFFVRIGRCSEIGGGELWMATEHGASARSMHERISQLNLRESERRRAQGIKMNLPTISSSVLKSRAHRERSQTQNQLQKANSQFRLRGAVPDSARSACSYQSESAENCSSRKASSNSTNRVKKNHHLHASNGSLSGVNTNPTQQLEPIRAASHACRTDSVSSGLHSIPEQRVLNDDERNNGDDHQQEQGKSGPSEQRQHSEAVQTKKTSIAGLFVSRFGAKMSDQVTAPSSPATRTVGMTFEFTGKVGSVLGFRLTRNNSNANTAFANRQTVAQRTTSASANAAIFSANPTYDCAEDYMTLYDTDNTTAQLQQQQYGYSLNAPSGSVGSRMSAVSKDESRKSSSSAAPYRQFSTGSTGYSSDTQQQGKGLGIISADYVEMGAYQSHADESNFSLSEVHSYVPNSSEPYWTSPGTSNNNGFCCSDLGSQPTGAEAPRAYSLGSKPHQTQSLSCCSMRPSSSEMSRTPQLLHPCSNSSPPNYLKKVKIGQTAKNLHKEALEANFNGRIGHKECPTTHEGKKASVGIMGDTLTLSEDKTNEMRKRAHSTGSKALIKSSLKKLTASSAAFNNRKTLGIDDELSSIDGTNSRRNTCEANKSMCSSTTCYPHSEDHVEIDFDRDESPSVSSLPSLHSRNSSIGMMSSGVRSALDSIGREKPSERLIREQIGKTSTSNIESVQHGRKRSVPEMFQGENNGNSNAKTHSLCSELVEQNRLHPHRRLTYDGSALSIRMRSKEKRTQQLHQANKLGRSPPRCVTIGRQPSRQSTSSGISTSKSSESTTTTAADCSQIGPVGSHQQNSNATTVEAIAERKESDESDYVLMQSTLNGGDEGNETSIIGESDGAGTKSVQQQLNVRTIGTIMESSSSPCSSLASAQSGGTGPKSPANNWGIPFVQSENAKLKADDKNLQMTSLSLTDFPDDYHELSPSKLTPFSSPQQLQQDTVAVPAAKSRSPSCSPHVQTRRLPHRQLSHCQNACPSSTRAYLPTNETVNNNVRPSTRRKISERRDYQLKNERKKRSEGQHSKKEDDEQRHRCDYAIIATSNDNT